MPQKDNNLLQDLVDRYVKILAVLAHRHGVPVDDTEDVAMEAIYSFYRSEHFGKLDETDTKKMLATIIRNKSIDHYRKEKPVGDTPPESYDEAVNKIAAPPQYEPENILFKDDRHKYVREVVERMPPKLREVAIMFYMEEYSYAEISKALGISEEACRKRGSRAREYLVAELSEYVEK